MASTTTSNVGQFTTRFETMVTAAATRVDRVLQGAGFLLGEAITVGNRFGPGTPVDKGVAVNSWWVVVGRGAVDPGAHPNPPEPPVGDDRLAPRAAFDAAVVRILGAKAGDTLVYANGAVYINRLEYEGHSAQAPNGFVRIAAAQWAQIVDAVAAALPPDAGSATAGAPT